jgi:hypothetical protein
MPLPEELRPSIDSQVADLANIGERHGGMMTAAVFLREFVGKGKDGEQIPWAHIDIAGPSFNNGSPYGYTHKQGTGCTVRTLVAYVAHILAAAASPHRPLRQPRRPCGTGIVPCAAGPRDTGHKRSTNAAPRWSMDKWFAKVNHGSHKCKRTSTLA